MYTSIHIHMQSSGLTCNPGVEIVSDRFSVRSRSLAVWTDYVE